jgi:hypothetical protein
MEIGLHRHRRLLHGETRAWVSLVLLAMVAVMIPWTLWLSVVLPSKHTSHDWDATWVGFDVVLLLVLGLTAVAFRRHWHGLPIVASAAGVLLFADAWFDIALSGAAASSLVLALLAEIPVGSFCLWLAWVGTKDLEATSRVDRRAPGRESPRPHTPDRRRPAARSRAS